jgi:hypothetical protein
MNEFQIFVDWAFKGMIGGALYLGLVSFKRMTEAVEALNVKIAVLIERTEHHAKTIERHDERISNIEKKV